MKSLCFRDIANSPDHDSAAGSRAKRRVPANRPQIGLDAPPPIRSIPRLAERELHTGIKGDGMNSTTNLQLHAALLAFADVQAAIEEFNQGGVNLFDAIDRIRTALERIPQLSSLLRKSA